MNGNQRIKHRACFTKKRKSKKLKAHARMLRTQFRAERNRAREEKRSQ